MKIAVSGLEQLYQALSDVIGETDGVLEAKDVKDNRTNYRGYLRRECTPESSCS